MVGCHVLVRLYASGLRPSPHSVRDFDMEPFATAASRRYPTASQFT